jgi:hypothetical protein
VSVAPPSRRETEVLAREDEQQVIRAAAHELFFVLERVDQGAAGLAWNQSQIRGYASAFARLCMIANSRCKGKRELGA